MKNQKEPEFNFYVSEKPIAWEIHMSSWDDIIRDYERSKTLKFKIRLFFLKIKWFLFDREMLRL